MNLALFDFDGTITTQDSFLLFMRYLHGSSKFYLGCGPLAPYIGLYVLKLYPNYRLKCDFLRRFVQGYTDSQLTAGAQGFCNDMIPSILRSKAVERLNWHRRQGDTVAIVSACPEVILAPWCRQNRYELLATKLQFHDRTATGLLDGANCWGEEKVERIKGHFPLSDYGEIFAYGDSKGDHPMLSLADHAFYKPFRE